MQHIAFSGFNNGMIGHLDLVFDHHIAGNARVSANFNPVVQLYRAAGDVGIVIHMDMVFQHTVAFDDRIAENLRAVADRWTLIDSAARDDPRLTINLRAVADPNIVLVIAF